jgi:hypothetical protein
MRSFPHVSISLLDFLPWVPPDVLILGVALGTARRRYALHRGGLYVCGTGVFRPVYQPWGRAALPDAPL